MPVEYEVDARGICYKPNPASYRHGRDIDLLRVHICWREVHVMKITVTRQHTIASHINEGFAYHKTTFAALQARYRRR